MKISTSSKSNNYKWTHSCSNIQYRKTNIEIDNKNKSYYALSFTCDFLLNDVVYFAYSVPYTFTMLDRYLLEIGNYN